MSERVCHYGRCALRQKHNSHIIDLDATDNAGNTLLQDCPGQYSDCANCDDRKCMGCIFREYGHKCADDCPECC